MKRLQNIAAFKTANKELAEAMRILQREFDNIYRHSEGGGGTTVVGGVTVTSSGVSAAELQSVSNAVAALSLTVESLATQLTQVPMYYETVGTPPAGLGKNGDTAFDTVGRLRYKKEENVWVGQ